MQRVDGAVHDRRRADRTVVGTGSALEDIGEAQAPAALAGLRIEGLEVVAVVAGGGGHRDALRDHHRRIPGAERSPPQEFHGHRWGRFELEAGVYAQGLVGAAPMRPFLGRQQPGHESDRQQRDQDSHRRFLPGWGDVKG